MEWNGVSYGKVVSLSSFWHLRWFIDKKKAFGREMLLLICHGQVPENLTSLNVEPVCVQQIIIRKKTPPANSIKKKKEPVCEQHIINRKKTHK